MTLDEVSNHPQVQRARSWIHARDADTVAEQARLAAIPAPSGGETDRATHIRRRFEEIGLATTHDAVGNVVGVLHPSAGSEAFEPPPIVLAAHLDTIFPEGTEVRTAWRDGRLCGPGSTDNARGLAAMLALTESIRRSGIAPDRPIHFVGTVGEEGLGDLRGVKHLFRAGSPYRACAGFVALDGAGLSRVVTGAIGAVRLRARFSGLGGHSWGDRGMPNPVHALGVAIARLAGSPLRGTGETAVNVGRIGGGTSVNAIPGEAWLELDLRSDRGEDLERLEDEARRTLEEAVAGESSRATRPSPLAVEIDRIGHRPCGATPADARIVEITLAATRMLGGTPELVGSSTDANVPISLGIPAVAIGAGGRSGGVHSLGEWYENHDGPVGIERALLVILALAGLRENDQDRFESMSTTE